ncbi:hypothetical protein NQ317_017667 [Molorchus minor]|uniref:CUB domain-containing protein n=1 Tax=Molorchus minor TaxID=1323400 RepID=A0ABQ9JXU6_9CUCU|nr:hypothetical protein NQ317_017667 [Molorchus minor]
MRERYMAPQIQIGRVHCTHLCEFFLGLLVALVLFRLDFDDLNIAGPEPLNHICKYDQFIISGGGPAPSICGNNIGNHIYVDAGSGTTNPVILSVVTSGPTYERSWKIRILQIPCSANYKAEEGCSQYFTGVAGQILSFNYDPESGAQLSNQDYSICIRAERNFCGVHYSQCSDPGAENNRSQSFTLSGNSNNRVAAMIGSTGSSNFCQADYLIIPMATNVGRPVTGPLSSVDRICGGVLSADVTLTPTTVRTLVEMVWIIDSDSVLRTSSRDSNNGVYADSSCRPISVLRGIAERDNYFEVDKLKQPCDGLCRLGAVNYIVTENLWGYRKP